MLSKPISQEDMFDFNSSLMGADYKRETAWVICPMLELHDKSGFPPVMQDIMHLDELALKRH